MSRGYFITFEGGDGSGKSTQIRLLEEHLREAGYDVVLTREPGGTAISEKIRELILDPANEEMDDMTEAFLYAAARAQLVSQLIKPALEEGKIVICDRFVDSSIAYQAFGRGLGDAVGVINTYASGRMYAGSDHSSETGSGCGQRQDRGQRTRPHRTGSGRVSQKSQSGVQLS